ncbi:MAG: hypothetical protein H7X71_08120 [Chitinophagales bacterium]|nr:hypothetical protein [Chitinophagales bacterium]
MKTLPINKRTIQKTAKGTNFLILGSEVTPSKAMKEVVKSKVNKSTPDPVPGMWATLGSADDKEIFWQGTLQFSENGNDRSTGAVSEEVEVIKLLNHEEIEKTGKKIIERFINFDHIDFKLNDKIDPGEIPELRLTLFLKPNEGALTFYELYDGEFEKGKEAEVEYIMPEKTNDAHTTDRDRLTYLFHALPLHALQKEKGRLFSFNKNKKSSFIIKVLTFPRNNKSKKPEEIITNMVRGLLPEKDHRLLVYNSGTNAFIDTQGNSTFKINTSLKTLLLIHGTFSDTEKSFSGLQQEKVNGRSWLQNLIHEGHYRQILALDHPSIVADAKDNVSYLKKLLNGAVFSASNPVSIITTSRGGLVGKYILIDEDMQKNIMPVDKAILIACANGVHYFDVGQKISKFLSLLRSAMRIMGGGAHLAGIISFAQFSADYFLKLPGSELMTINHDRLKFITGRKPVWPTTKIFPITDDWDRKLQDDVGWVRRMTGRGFDLVLKKIVFKGMEHDWVVATDHQKIMPEGFLDISLNQRVCIPEFCLMVNPYHPLKMK